MIGDSRVTLKTLPDNSVDSIVTDPPYELGFMGRKWDRSGIAYDVTLWAECLRVLKPGGHLLAFGGTRTCHRMACAIEDAGFEIRDMMAWLYGSGFPKSLNLQKAGADGWDGWGTALKPALEPITFARKPLEKGFTIVHNVETWGTGGINIDGCRVGCNRPATTAKDFASWREKEGRKDSQVACPDTDTEKGRFPANLIHDGSPDVLDLFPVTAKSSSGKRNPNGKPGLNAFGDFEAEPEKVSGHDDEGGSASRFFYCAKASKADREAGLSGHALQDVSGSLNMRADAHAVANGNATAPRKNNHPTVKPNSLMRYLVRLVTPPGGTVLDPFTGSGSTGRAAVQEGFFFVGSELSPEFGAIADSRISDGAGEDQEEKPAAVSSPAVKNPGKTRKDKHRDQLDFFGSLAG